MKGADVSELEFSNLIKPGSQNLWIEDMPADAYHADKTAVGSSALRKILKSPRAFEACFFGEDSEQTDAMRLGTIAHMAVLEPKKFASMYVVMPEFTGFTKDGRPSAQSGEAREKKARWLAELPAGSMVVTQEERDIVFGMIDSILAHRDASTLLAKSVPEYTGYYVDPETGIRCKLRADLWSQTHGAMTDLKTCTDCAIEAFSRTIWDRRYDFQVAQYGEGASLIEGRQVNYPAFIAVENKKPYEVAVYVADDLMIEIGKRDYHRALRSLKQCIDKKSFAPYQTNVQNISLPLWAVNSSQIGSAS